MNRKTWISLLLAAVFLCSLFPASAEEIPAEDTWFCLLCGSETGGDACPFCGVIREAWDCASCGTRNLSDACRSCS